MTDETHKESGSDFGWAVRQLKAGYAVQRDGWNGKGMFICLRRGQEVAIATGPWDVWFTGTHTADHICMRAADGSCVVGWLASQTDMLAEDWRPYEASCA